MRNVALAAPTKSRCPRAWITDTSAFPTEGTRTGTTAAGGVAVTSNLAAAGPHAHSGLFVSEVSCAKTGDARSTNRSATVFMIPSRRTSHAAEVHRRRRPQEFSPVD